MTFIDTVDNPLLILLYATIAVFVVAQMNHMYRATPKIEIAAWWFLGVGSFSVVVFEIHNVKNEWAHIMFGIGAALLVTIHAQPRWRPYIANRRRNPEQPLPADCDRRCQTFMKTRKLRQQSDDEAHV